MLFYGAGQILLLLAGVCACQISVCLSLTLDETTDCCRRKLGHRRNGPCSPGQHACAEVEEVQTAGQHCVKWVCSRRLTCTVVCQTSLSQECHTVLDEGHQRVLLVDGYCDCIDYKCGRCQPLQEKLQSFWIPAPTCVYCHTCMMGKILACHELLVRCIEALPM